ncbi:hypothetical protein [Lapidilactobacillus gannanensis]|uniref:Uncharacterized protein n=1 Tax=Lapidilactobacillus gannanensis TaxID=2486002 RepID=A0ABW4BLU3_9LACO
MGVETKLVLTPLRACWLWNAAGIDLNQLKTEKFKTFKTLVKVLKQNWLL